MLTLLLHGLMLNLQLISHYSKTVNKKLTISKYSIIFHGIFFLPVVLSPAVDDICNSIQMPNLTNYFIDTNNPYKIFNQ